MWRIRCGSGNNSSLIRTAGINRFFIAGLVNADKSDIGFKNMGNAAGVAILAGNFNIISRRRVTEPDQFRFKLQDGTELDALFEYHIVQSNRDKFMGRKLEIGCDIANFVDPLQQIAAE